MNKVFVYGTLKNLGEDDNWQISGTLYNVTRAGFPAVQLDGARLVPGQLHEISDAYLAYLDRVEGVPHLYRRELVVVENKITKEKVDAWIYVWNAGPNHLGTIIDRW